MKNPGKTIKVPQVNELVKPTLRALILLGGSGNIQEINEKVYGIINLSDEILNIPHSNDGRTQIEYRLAWARTRLKLLGLLENSSRGIWTLTKSDIDPNNINLDEDQKILDHSRRTSSKAKKEQLKEDQETPEIAHWKVDLIKHLYGIKPDAFERLAQKILRESGFTQVEVTGKTGDGGIDGKGIVRLNGFLSFHVIFQCKRYRGSVSPSQIRDFRGAMQGRTDKGIFITTGTYTREARKEATREGAFTIDLIDGDLLCNKLKELGLGIKTELIEKVSVDAEWFNLI